MAALHLDSQGRCGGVRAMFIAGALHGVEASSLSQGSLLKLRSGVRSCVCLMELMGVILVSALSGLGSA